MTVYVYGLLCPITGVVRYVGLSRDYQRRFIQHAFSSTTHVGAWAAALRSRGESIIPFVLQTCPNERIASEAERSWIQKFSAAGLPLLSVQHLGGPRMYRPRLRRWLDANGRNQMWLAEAMDVRQSTVSAWCRGAGMSHEHATKLRALTGLSDEDLLLIVPAEGEASTPDLSAVDADNTDAA